MRGQLCCYSGMSVLLCDQFVRANPAIRCAARHRCFGRVTGGSTLVAGSLDVLDGRSSWARTDAVAHFRNGQLGLCIASPALVQRFWTPVSRDTIGALQHSIARQAHNSITVLARKVRRQTACFSSMIGRCRRPSWSITESVSRTRDRISSRRAGYFVRGSKRRGWFARVRPSSTSNGVDPPSV